MGIDHDAWMRLAIEQAVLAQELGEVPVGAVLVKDNTLIASGHNLPITNHDPSAHAEMITLRRAGEQLNNYRLTGTTLYVTLEPCMMCAGLLVHARIQQVIFGATDPKAGCVQSIAQLLESPKLNHQVAYQGGILQEECSALLTCFFKKRRG